MDNYVGCDMNGWAFLANKAIWHNKSKLKAYGELFRAGDIISVYLDLVLGNLSFAINGKNLGVAADGLTGEFYPAFSLYNEDDQITLLPLRTSADCRPSPALSWSSSSVEMLLDRYDSFLGVLLILNRTYDNVDDSSNVATSVTRSAVVDLAERELLQRHNMWIGGQGGVRTVSVLGEIVTVTMSPQRCAALCTPPMRPLLPGVIVDWEKGHSCELIGSGSHRLWFQSQSSGDIFGCCQERVKQALQDKSYVAESPWVNLFASTGLSQLEECDLQAALVGRNTGRTWSLAKDLALVRFLEQVAGGRTTNPALVSVQTILNPANDCPLRAEISDGELLVRVSLLLMLNDLAQLLLPVLSAGSMPFVLEPEIAKLLSVQSGLLFLSSKLEFAFKNMPLLPNFSTPASPPPSLSDTATNTAELSLSDALPSPLGEIEILAEEDALAHLVAETEASARALLFTDPRWRLLAGLQSSVPIQLLRCVEASLEAETVSLDAAERVLRACTWSRHPSLSSMRCSLQIAFVRPEGTIRGASALLAFLQLGASQMERALIVVASGIGPNDRAESSMLLTFFQAAGLVCGIAINNSMPFRVDFSDEFLYVLVGSGSNDAESACRGDSEYISHVSLSVLCAHAFRRGLITVFPESALALLTRDDFRVLVHDAK